MSIDISAFRGISSTSGYVKADPAGVGIKRFGGSGLFGKISTWIKGSADSNKAIKSEFMAALTKTYGQDFLKSPAVKRLLDDGQRQFQDSAKPLSARLVREIVDIGDQVLSSMAKPVEAKVRLANVDCQVKLQYADAAAMKQAGALFSRQANFGDKGSALLADMMQYINLPSDEKLQNLIKASGGIDVAGMAKAFEIGSDYASLLEKTSVAQSPVVVKHCQKINVDEARIAKAASAMAQIPTRMAMMAGALASHAGKNQVLFEKELKEILETMQNQINDLRQGIEVMSDSKFFKGLPSTEAKLLSVLRQEAIVQHEAMTDPKGVFQHFLAFATVAATNPVEARSQMLASLTEQAK